MRWSRRWEWIDALGEPGFGAVGVDRHHRSHRQLRDRLRLMGMEDRSSDDDNTVSGLAVTGGSRADSHGVVGRKLRRPQLSLPGTGATVNILPVMCYE